MYRAHGCTWAVGGAVQVFPLFSAIMILTIIAMSDPVMGVRLCQQEYPHHSSSQP